MIKRENQNKPPFTITSKILNLVSKISEAAAKLEILEHQAITPILRKANKIKTITGTLEIEGNALGIELEKLLSGDEAQLKKKPDDFLIKLNSLKNQIENLIEQLENGLKLHLHLKS